MTTFDSFGEFDNPVDHVAIPQAKKRYLRVKQWFDTIFASLGLIVLFPVLLLIALAVFIDDPKGGNPIFIQDRLGKNMKKFKCLKFRTMNKKAPCDLATRQFTDARKYITRHGAFLRKTSLDELPQLWNVIKGDMSLVGPRPLILAEADVHEKRRKQGIYAIKPGLTGLAQINGRDLVDDVEKVDFDYSYLVNISPRLDFAIALGTLHKVIMMADIRDGKSIAEWNSPPIDEEYKK